MNYGIENYLDCMMAMSNHGRRANGAAGKGNY
jgi:hypothetical protein